MKRLLVLLVCVGMLVSLAACTSEPVNTNTNNSNNAVSDNSSGNQLMDEEKTCTHSWEEQTCEKPKPANFAERQMKLQPVIIMKMQPVQNLKHAKFAVRPVVLH